MAQIETEQPRWRQVYAVISGRIRSGEIEVGERVPSLVDLTAEFGIANATAQKVIRQLRADGLIRTEPGIGSKVADREYWESETA
ncbi:winged helix-turn-helix domain-containing protein [Nonomuraea sp. NEAU-A123]|uniref:GntR family transcriptional regulator n=1 Tax=Nonomuraea sp. NEAU-A123 TaxID=2839649 RepID=UPI001BE3DAE3|nr:winged helix-turn-helix domain-containing protein [Nonomuraea sp. NEAU-A123]MBT2232048.1 winged helix-turn-helix domain-containing protein [Nonomuraea sp. NEAU-A123]